MKFISKSLALLLALGLVGCSNQESTSSTNEVVVTEDSNEKSDDTANLDKIDQKENQANEESDEKSYDLNLTVLAGPTGAGAINMIDQGKLDDSIFKITEAVEGAPDAVIPKLVSGETDLAIIPPNLASAVYNKTEGKIKTLAINNLGVLYIVENGEATIKTIDDLVNSGETIYASGKGATPELAINQVLSAHGYDPSDINIEYVSEASELAQKMIAGEAKLALMPEPMVSTVLMKADNANVVLDINKLYEQATDSPLISAVLVGRDEYLDEIDVKELLAIYKESIDKANNDIDHTAALLGQYDIMPEPVAEKALSNLALEYIDGDKMHDMLKNHLQNLYDYNPELVGGSVPDDDFYFIQK